MILMRTKHAKIFTLLLITLALAISQQNDDDNTSDKDNKCPINSKYISLTNQENKKCFAYGCPIHPLDIIFENDLQEIIKIANEQEKLLYSTKFATLTLTGNKGKQSLNQDRAFVVPNFQTESSILKKLNDNELCIQETTNESKLKLNPSILLGVFDGHGHEGEVVSQHSVTSIPDLLHKIKIDNDPEYDVDTHIKEIIVDAFHAVNSTVSSSSMGGCTGSVVMQLGDKVYIANTGDSRSFLALVRIMDDDEASTSVEIIYATEEHKPDLPSERTRVESYGGTVYIPPTNPNSAKKGTSRVVYQNRLGGTVGLAMSRSIGDWDGANSGIIATPHVDVIDLNELLHNITKLDNQENKLQCQKNEINDDASAESNECANTNKKYKVFAVSATDGLLDALSLQTIADTLSDSLYYHDIFKTTGENEEEDSRKTLIGTCYHLVVQAAKEWGNGYRDDIALSVGDIQLPL